MRSHTLSLAAAAILFASMSGFTSAQALLPLPLRPQLSLDAAQRVAETARQACASGYQREVAVAVLDAGAQPLLLLRGDGVGPHNLEAARRKAFSALSTRQPTLALGRQARSQPDTAGLAYLPELLLLGGGVPLWQGTDLVGAIGVAGGGGPENDDACARAATLLFTQPGDSR